MPNRFIAIAALAGSLCLNTAVFAGGHTSHGKELVPPEMTQEQMDGVRDKIKKFANYSDEQLLDMMARLTNESGMLSAEDTRGDVGVLVLAHGFHGEGFTQFKEQFAPVIDAYPTAYGFGLFIMESAPMQAAIDGLQAQGAQTILIVPATTADNSTMVRQWKYILGDIDEPSYLDVPRVENDVEYVWAPNP